MPQRLQGGGAEVEQEENSESGSPSKLLELLVCSVQEDTASRRAGSPDLLGPGCASGG